jgi:glycerol-3-phosphate dehydrogenase
MGKWYGEPGLKSRDRFAARLREVIQIPEQNIDLPWDRLWRIYGVGAIEILESILSENRGAELVIRPAKICRAELELIRNQEMVVTLEDFLRRRTLLAQTHGLSELASMPGIRAACEVLFGNQAEQRYEEYFQMHPPIEIQSSHTNKNINAKVEVVRKP